MPTGYTAGIIDGTITSFETFAINCSRAFGACMHMRDESMDTEWIPREPSKYHADKLDSLNKELKLINDSTDEELEKSEFDSLTKDLEYHKLSIEKIKLQKQKLEEFLITAKKWTPPTTEHEGIKKFMIEQIQSTIDFDTNFSYHDKAVSEKELQINSLVGSDIRVSKIASIQKDIKYHHDEFQKDIERCNQANKWMWDLKASLGNV